MSPFWKKKELTPDEERLIEAVCSAHYQSTFRQNPSSLAIAIAAQGSGDLLQSLAAGLCTLGGRHGPIDATYDWLQQPGDPSENVEAFFAKHPEGRIPGWGSSFSKGQVDQAWVPVDALIQEKWPKTYDVIRSYTGALHERNIIIAPNPSAYTAAAAIILEMPREIAPYLLVLGRLTAWVELFLNETRKGK